MASKKYTLEFTAVTVIEIDDDVISSVDDEWRKLLYPLITPEDIAEHIGYNMVINHAKLSHVEGFADKDDSQANIMLSPEFNVHCIDVVKA